MIHFLVVKIPLDLGPFFLDMFEIKHEVKDFTSTCHLSTSQLWQFLYWNVWSIPSKKQIQKQEHKNINTKTQIQKQE